MIAAHIVNVLDATNLYILNLFILCYVNFISIFKIKGENYNTKFRINILWIGGGKGHSV